MTMIQKHYRVPEIVKLLGVSRSCVYLWIQQGDLKAVRYGRRALGVPETELREFMKGKHTEAAK